jgi:hypothetical protein
MNCPTCAEPLAERGVFCKACAAQARCMKCRELLEPGAIACVECGTRIGPPVEAANGTGQGSAPSASALPANRNTLTYNEDRNSRCFEASLTDSAMHGLGDVFGELFAQRGVGRTITHATGKTLLRNDVTLDDLKQLPPAAPAPADHGAANPGTKAAPAETNKERILQIFSFNGEVLELTDNRLKGTTAADYYRRLTYLFLYANELHGRPTTPKDDLVAVLKEAKVYDTNCRTWLKLKKGFTVDTEDRLKLIAGAREQAVKSLNEALDSNVPDVWNPDNKTAKPRTKKKA